MKCYICDATLSKPNFSADHDTYDPCEYCLFVVRETLEGFTDGASAPEDAWEEVPLFSLHSMTYEMDEDFT